jgi:oligopeptide/dipeptide ABC transporter ATP-binding protein
MAQRVSIACALAGRPRVLIADEPTTALDVTIQGEILDLLRRLQAEAGMAIVLISHDLGVVADLCDRVAVMYAGEIVEIADAEDIFQRPSHPYTRALLDSNPITSRRGAALPVIRGTVPSPADWPLGCHFQDRCRFRVAACAERPIPLVCVAEGHDTRCIRVGELDLARRLEEASQ